MPNGFTEQERLDYLTKKYIRDHLLEFVLDLIGRVLMTLLILKLCRAESLAYGVLLAAIWSLGRTAQEVVRYRKSRKEKPKAPEKNEDREKN